MTAPWPVIGRMGLTRPPRPKDPKKTRTKGEILRWKGKPKFTCLLLEPTHNCRNPLCKAHYGCSGWVWNCLILSIVDEYAYAHFPKVFEVQQFCAERGGKDGDHWDTISPEEI